MMSALAIALLINKDGSKTYDVCLGLLFIQTQRAARPVVSAKASSLDQHRR